MLHKLNLVSALQVGTIAASLLFSPCGILAQRGPGSTGGGSAGGGGLSGGGRATGLAVKDDLKGFHQAMAVEATSQQVAAYELMMKSTEAADAELQAFLQAQATAKQEDSSAIAAGAVTLDQVIESARVGNKKFLDELSELQKSGLKETIKKVTKADFDLAQQVKVFDLEARDPKVVASQITLSAQHLSGALAAFHSREVELGDEMSIGNSADRQESFELPPVRNSLKIAEQSVALTTSGTITQSPGETGKHIFKVQLTADLSDLQRNMTEVLRAKLEKSETCGERIGIQSATLAPRVQASVAVVQLHYERWSCRGAERMTEIVEGNGTIEVKLAPSVGDNAKLQLAAEIGRVDAGGLLGDMLRSGALGDSLRDQITEVVLTAIRDGADFKAILPSAARDSATLQTIHFQSTGSGKLFLTAEGTFQVPNEQLTAFTTELKGRTASPQTVPR